MAHRTQTRSPRRTQVSHTETADAPDAATPHPDKAPARRRPRRSQAERRAQTRLDLLDATVDCLVDRGYPRTSTSAIARRAGVSVGALQHHFDSKADLLSAAIEHVLERRLEEFAASMSVRDADADPFDTAIDALWELVSGPTFLAWLELSVAARGDRLLAEAMAETDERFAVAAAQQFATWFGDVPGLTTAEKRDRVLDLAFATLNGLALRQVGGEDHERLQAQATGVLTGLKDLSRIVYPRVAA